MARSPFRAPSVGGPRIERSDSKDIAPNNFMPDGTIGPDHLHNQQGVMLLGVGNPLLDISAKVPLAVVEKYGLKPGDIILAEEQHAGIYDELVASHSPEYIAGGATQNSCRVCAWMLKAANKSGAVAFTGCVGSDANAKTLAERAEAGGVAVARAGVSHRFLPRLPDYQLQAVVSICKIFPTFRGLANFAATKSLLCVL